MEHVTCYTTKLALLWGVFLSLFDLCTLLVETICFLSCKACLFSIYCSLGFHNLLNLVHVDSWDWLNKDRNNLHAFPQSREQAGKQTWVGIWVSKLMGNTIYCLNFFQAVSIQRQSLGKLFPNKISFAIYLVRFF